MVVEMVVEAVAEAAEVVVRSLRMLDIEGLVLVDVHLELLEQIRGQMDSKREDADAKERSCFEDLSASSTSGCNTSCIEVVVSKQLVDRCGG